MYIYISHIKENLKYTRLFYSYMSQAEWFTTYLQYETLKDMLSVILYTSQSFMTITPLLYHITYQKKEILFIHTGIVGGIVAHYHIIEEKPRNS